MYTPLVYLIDSYLTYVIESKFTMFTFLSSREMELLLNYLCEWRDWVNEGAPESDYFHRREGLCVTNRLSEDTLAKDVLIRTLKHEFGEHYLYPFEGVEAYDARAIYGTQHKNPLRLAWVDKTIASLREHLPS